MRCIEAVLENRTNSSPLFRLNLTFERSLTGLRFDPLTNCELGSFWNLRSFFALIRMGSFVLEKVVLVNDRRGWIHKRTPFSV